MLKKILIFLILIISVSSVYGRECLDLEDSASGCDILTYTVNTTNQYQVFSSATCILNMSRPDTTTVSATMTNGRKGVGWHNYTFQQTALGVYTLNIRCSYGGFYSRQAGVITVGNSIPRQISSLNNSLDADITVITNNQDTILGAVASNGSFTISMLEQAIIGNATSISSLMCLETTAQSILTDTSAMDTANEWEFLMSSTLSNLSSTHGSGAWGGYSALNSSTLRSIGVYVANTTVNNSYPGNNQGLGERTYWTEVSR